MPMFIDLSSAAYRPLRGLFHQALLEEALQLCWDLPMYRNQIAVVTEFLSLQRDRRISYKVTVEDLTELLDKKNKESLAAQLWKSKLEHIEEEETRALLDLAWGLMNSLRRGDVEFEARKLLESPEDIPPSFQQPKLRKLAQEYSRTLTEQLNTAPSSWLLSPQEVVMEIVPKVCQTLWEPPRHTYLSTPSQRLSLLALRVTKGVLDQVVSALSPGQQISVSRSTRDKVVQAIEETVRPPDEPTLTLLYLSSTSFDLQLLKIITEATAKEIQKLFQPKTDVKPAANQAPTSKPSVVQRFLRRLR